MRISSFSPDISLSQAAVGTRSRRNPVSFSLRNADAPTPGALTKAKRVLSLSSEGLSAAAGSAADVPNRPVKGQNSVSGSLLTPTIDQKEKTAATQTPPRDPVPVPLTGNIGVDAISLLSADLLKRGLDPASFQFSYSEQTVGYPGGSYVNKLISAKVNGQTENYDAGLVLKNPQIASVEILRLLTGARSS